MFCSLSSVFMLESNTILGNLLLMNPDMKLQIKGLAFVGTIVAIGAAIVTYYVYDMSSSALMGASPDWKPHFPAVPTTDITQAPQCAEGYDKQWVGCQKLAE